MAPGPGYFCIELAKLGAYSITGLYISHTLVEIAKKKAAEAAMPFGDGSFDFLLRRAAFKNFS